MRDQMTNWNNDRLDELNRRVDNGFKSADQRFIRLEGEMKEGFAKVDKRFERVEREMKEGFARVDEDMKEGFAKVDQDMKEGFAELREEMRYLGGRFDRLLHTLAFSAVGFAGAMLAAFVGLIYF